MDFDISMEAHPINKDIVSLSGQQAIMRSVKNLLLTAVYERPFQAGLGSNIRELLFETMNVHNQEEIKRRVREVLNNYEPRVEVEDVILDYGNEDNSLNISVSFFTDEDTMPTTMELRING